MKTTLWVLLFLCASALCAEVLFYDNFNRANGAVGNSWTNIGSATNTIENNALKIVSPNGTGIKHDFSPVSSGVVYIQYDWKVVSTGWYADAFPTGLITHLVMDWDGNMFYDLDGTMINQVALQQIGLNSYASIRLKIDLDADLFSVWINNVPAAENIAGNAVSSFSSFTFRGLGASTVQYVDNFLLFNGTSPSGFTATGNLNDIALNWNASSYPEALSYRIYRDTASPAVTLLTELPGTASGYTDSSAQPNTDYYYRIKAVQAGAVETDFSPELMAHLQPQIAVTPQNITFNVGYGYSDSTYVTIGNSGNYPLEWSIQGSSLLSHITTDGLVSYIPFQGTYNDQYGQNHGVNYGTTFTTDKSGRSDSAIFIENQFSGNQFVSLGNNINLSNHSFTISFWGTSIDANLPRWAVSQGQLSYNLGLHIGYRTQNEAYRFTFDFYGDGVDTPSGYFTDGWHMWTCTYDLTSNTKSIYRDGVLLASAGSNVYQGTGEFLVGKRSDSESGWYGKLDDMLIYNRALTPAEVLNIYNQSSSETVYPVSTIYSGTLGAGNSTDIPVVVNATNLCLGSHIDTLYVESNDPANPIIPIFITTNVLPPDPVITPEPLVVNLNVDNPTRETQIQLSNVGQGRLEYQLSGTDSLGEPNQLPVINGLTAMGVYNGHRYYLSNTPMSWSAANQLCLQNGGHLATISDALENQFITDHLTSIGWLGFSDQGSEGTWEWITGEPLVYTNWAPGEPNNIWDYDQDEDYAAIFPPSHIDTGLWNDRPNDRYNSVHPLPFAILEFDNLTGSFLTFVPNFGLVIPSSSVSVNVTADGENLSDGVYSSSIRVSAEGVPEPWYFPVTVNVDYTPPLTVSGLAVDPTSTNDDQIGITWFANAVADSVVSYKIYRRGADEAVWQLKATVPATQLAYVDSDFGDFVATYQYYRVRAVDWVGNISAVGDSVMGALNRFLSPANMVIQNINNRDIHLSWDPVTETISGLPGTPTCYVIYKSQYPSPITDFDFLTISFTNEFTHQWALHFQPLNRLFYVVTAYGGDMGRMESLVAQKREWKYGELEQVMQESGFQQLDVIK